jgi:ribbon-helix-helix protein
MENSHRESPKTPTTIRLKPDSLEQLKALANTTGRTVSSLIDAAVEEYLNRKPESLVPVISKELLIGSEELKRMTDVVEAMGKPLPLNLFLDLISTLLKGKTVAET